MKTKSRREKFKGSNGLEQKVLKRVEPEMVCGGLVHVQLSVKVLGLKTKTCFKGCNQ